MISSRRRSMRFNDYSLSGPSVEELLIELDGARDDLTHALSEIEHLQEETEEHCRTIDALRAKCQELEEELALKEKELEVLNRKNRYYNSTKEASRNRCTRKNMMDEMASYDTGDLDQDEDDFEDWRGMVVETQESPQMDQSYSSKHHSSKQQMSDSSRGGSGGGRLRNIFKKGGVREDVVPANDLDVSIQYYSDPEVPPGGGGGSGGGGWFGTLKGGNNSRGKDFSQNETVLMRQLHVLQSDRKREVRELELKLQQRESAISTLENALQAKDQSMKLLQEEFDAELGGRSVGRLFGRSRSKSRGRRMNDDADNRSIFSQKTKKEKKQRRGLLGNHVQADFDEREIDDAISVYSNKSHKKEKRRGQPQRRRPWGNHVQADFDADELDKMVRGAQ